MCIRKIALFGLACVLPLSAALACGPDFPQNLLDARKASLLDLPEGTFDFEAAHLLPPPDDHLHVADDAFSDDATEARTKAEAAGLTADELRKVVAMRAATKIDAAAAAGAGLAPELLDYTLGAIAFKARDMAIASEHFERVLALSPEQRPRRGLWAQYMLGRAEVVSGNTDGAIAAFGQVRKRALDGAADPLGLAVASYGEQARVHWHRGNVVAAVALYAEQAAHGSRSGRASLLFVARSLLAHPELLDKALDDPLSQRLLAAYFFARSSEFKQAWPMTGMTADATDSSQAAQSQTGIGIAGFLAAVERHGLDRFEGADRLAAGAYRAGRYDLAAKLAAKSDTALSAWVRAKLALRAGDSASAMREFALAARAFPVDESWNGDEFSTAVDSPHCRIETERGALALSRDDYAEAMARLYAGAKEHWSEAAYVAERVLTADELKTFVDRNVQPLRQQPPKTDHGVSTPAMQLRNLLARRLMRAGRLEEALAYFDESSSRAKAQALIDAQRENHAWLAVTRAAALFEQARITRIDGMQLFGTELAPDNTEWAGDFPAQDLPLGKDKTFVGKDEPARVAASAVQPDARYHYRSVASGLAERAAALVPARSQAYAAMMCQAARWLIDDDPKRAAGLYREYQQHGAYVKWGSDFGRSCPQPDFAAARWVPWKQRYWQARHWTKHEWPFALCGLGLVVIALAMLRRRRNAG